MRFRLEAGIHHPHAVHAAPCPVPGNKDIRSIGPPVSPKVVLDDFEGLRQVMLVSLLRVETLGVREREALLGGDTDGLDTRANG